MQKFSFRLMTVLTVLLAVCAIGNAQNKGFDTSRMDTSVDACTDFFSIC